jgi:hypothetical protein
LIEPLSQGDRAFNSTYPVEPGRYCGAISNVRFTPESGHVQFKRHVCFGPIADIASLIDLLRSVHRDQ